MPIRTSLLSSPWQSIALATTLLVTACGTPDLTPAPSAEQPAGETEAEVATASVGGVAVRVESGAWDGDSTVAHELTPLYIHIENRGDAPVRLRYREFALVGPQGQYYAALPPLAAQVDVQQVESARLPVGTPSFQHRGFFIAPPYKYAYGTLPAWEDGFDHDAFYHDTYHTTYTELDVSIEELQIQALPEGVLANNGHIDGYLYFERVDKDLPQVYFRADFVNAETGRTLGTARIPFIVGGD